jgi:Raf kinase inhibitor-like YbhB/YbcL family protein
MKKNVNSILICTLILSLMSLITKYESTTGTDLTTVQILSANQTPGTGNSFVLHSSEVADGGTLPVEFTGDGSGATLPLEWSGGPAETKSYTLIMHHIDREGKAKWYWTLYNIPANVRNLPKNVKNIGTTGNNSINSLTEYAPPHSRGPGQRAYTYTVYALSEKLELKIPPAQVSRDVLLAAMENHILATAELQVLYTSKEEK